VPKRIPLANEAESAMSLSRSVCAVSLSRAVGTGCPVFVLIPSVICPKVVIRKNERLVLMRKRSFIVLLMPILAILWLFSWVLSWNGGQEPRNNRTSTATKSVAIVHVASGGSVFASSNILSKGIER
jgi:hypothetical protein